jgi:predicted nucleotidyltransferase
MPYADPVTAAFALARNRLAHAAQQPSATVTCGRLLARALEFAVQGAFVAWKYPVAVPKVQGYFDSVMAAHLEPSDADFIKEVWADEGTSHPDLDLSGLVTACTAMVDRLEVLAGSAAPSGWSPPTVPPSIGWAGLSNDDQQLLTRVRECAQEQCPQARVILFGSRAKGTGGPDSDYDLLVILPDEIDQSVRSTIMGSLYSMAQQLGKGFDREHVSLSTWQNPGPADHDFVEQAKNYGIEISGTIDSG